MGAVKKPGRPVKSELKEQRTDEILRAAIELFAQCGFAQGDVQQLADRLEVGKGTIYRYFATKEELFFAAADRVMDELTQYVHAQMELQSDPLRQLEVAIEAYLTFFRQHRAYVELLIQERAYFKDRKKPTYFEHRDKNIKRFLDLLTRLIESGRVRKLPVEQISDVISDLVYGTMFTNHFASRNQPVKKQVQQILDVVLSGILIRE